MQTPTPILPPAKSQHPQMIIIAIGAFCLGLAVPLLGLYVNSIDRTHLGSKGNDNSTEQATVDNNGSENEDDNVFEKFSFRNFTWIGRIVDSSTYQLIRVNSAGEESLVYSHPRGFDFTEWTVYRAHENPMTVFTYNASPGEAFVTSTTIYFDENGEEVIRTTHTSPSGSLTVQKPGGPLHTITLDTAESCPTTTSGLNEYTGKWNTGQTTLLGIKVSSDDGASQMHSLPSPQTVSCGTAYGDQIIEPLIQNLNTSPTGATFELPTGGHAWVSFDDVSGNLKVGSY